MANITTVTGSTTLLSKATTNISASYLYTDPLYCTAGDQTFFLNVTKNATIGTVTIKCQISGDGTNFVDVVSRRADIGTDAIEHACTVAAAQTHYFAVICTEATRSIAMRVGVKADVQGGAGELITLTGTVA